MVSVADVRKLAASIVGAADESTDVRLAFSAGGKSFAWTFMRRPAPKAKRVPDLGVLAVSCTIESKHMLIEAAPDIYFDDDRYRGYPAILVRLDAIGKRELGALLKAACMLKQSGPRRRKRAAP
ncbi:MAG: MmcQ/YjbR family DNA-binding protein [Vitreimonas sp.]